MPTCLITGVTGQDGAYRAQLFADHVVTRSDLLPPAEADGLLVDANKASLQCHPSVTRQEMVDDDLAPHRARLAR